MQRTPIDIAVYRYDTETGLYYLQSRYYDPEIGRFINADDVDYLGASGTTLSYNLFAYCENNPVNKVDCDGTVSQFIISFLTGFIIGVISYFVNFMICKILKLPGNKWSWKGALSAGFWSGIGGIISATKWKSMTQAVITGVISFCTSRKSGDSLLISSITAVVTGIITYCSFPTGKYVSKYSKHLNTKFLSKNKKTIIKGIKYYVKQTKYSYKQLAKWTVYGSISSTVTSLIGKLFGW